MSQEYGWAKKLADEWAPAVENWVDRNICAPVFDRFYKPVSWNIHDARAVLNGHFPDLTQNQQDNIIQVLNKFDGVDGVEISGQISLVRMRVLLEPLWREKEPGSGANLLYTSQMVADTLYVRLNELDEAKKNHRTPSFFNLAAPITGKTNLYTIEEGNFRYFKQGNLNYFVEKNPLAVLSNSAQEPLKLLPTTDLNSGEELQIVEFASPRGPLLLPPEVDPETIRQFRTNLPLILEELRQIKTLLESGSYNHSLPFSESAATNLGFLTRSIAAYDKHPESEKAIELLFQGVSRPNANARMVIYTKQHLDELLSTLQTLHEKLKSSAANTSQLRTVMDEVASFLCSSFVGILNKGPYVPRRQFLPPIQRRAVTDGLSAATASRPPVGPALSEAATLARKTDDAVPPELAKPELVKQAADALVTGAREVKSQASATKDPKGKWIIIVVGAALLAAGGIAIALSGDDKKK